MGRRLGMFERPIHSGNSFAQGFDDVRAKASPLFPSEPQLSEEKWNRIVQYFLENAPDTPPAPPSHPDIKTGLDGFRVRELSFQWTPAIASLVDIDDESTPPRLYVGTLTPGSSTLTTFTSGFEEQDALTVRSGGAALTAFSSVRATERELYLTEMGRLPPVEDSSGKLVRVPRRPDLNEQSVTALLTGLKRPVSATYADFDGDDREDVAVAEFGSYTGRLAWRERREDGRFEDHTLRQKPGAIQVMSRDFTDDARPDILALFAQGDEGMFLYRNNGDGTFRERRLLEFPPTYGSSSFAVADVNEDGAVDIIHAAGDNSDYNPVVMKAYHGVRIFLNDGQNHFEEAYFYPLNGAYKAIPRDYDRDGDVDLATISFFPDYEASPEESFVYLENCGGAASLAFEPHTFERPARGRWLVLDSGDLDRDGDEDLILGSATGLGADSGYVPDRLYEHWKGEGPLVVFLENLSVNRDAASRMRP